MPKAKSIVLDSWAIMAYLEDEQAGEKVADLIADAHDNGVPLLMSVVNAGEIWYIVARRTTPAEADRTVKLLTDIGIKFIDADWPLTKIAAGFKVNGKISYADSYAAALATQEEAILFTGDTEFAQLESKIVIEWLN
jgi:predicted nucleic acid-binding protein